MMPIWVVDDDPDDSLITRKALEKNQVTNPVVFLKDGEELMVHLSKLNSRSHDPGVKRPALILLDMNMPKMDGRLVLEQIKASEEFRAIPVVVLSNSRDPEEIAMAYHLGANSYIIKPADFEIFVEVVGLLKNYWLETVKLPHMRSPAS